MRWITKGKVARVFAISTEKGFEGWDIKGAFFTLLTFEDGV